MRTASILLAAGLVLGTAQVAAAQTPAGPQIILPGMNSDSAMSDMDRSIFAHALLDQAEGRIGGGQNGFRWDGQAWIGTDYDKLWLKSEGPLSAHQVAESFADIFIAGITGQARRKAGQGAE